MAASRSTGKRLLSSRGACEKRGNLLNRILLLAAGGLCVFAENAPAQPKGGTDAPVSVSGLFGSIPGRFDHYDVVLGPDKDEADWWAGAPSVVRDKEGSFWLACRMRTAEGPRGLRGYEIRILRSEDGVHFEKVHSILRTDVPIPGFERPALLLDPKSGLFKLYGCGPWGTEEGPWSIIKWDDADRPDHFVATTAKPVIQPLPMAYERDIRPLGYKDPVILFAEGQYHAYLTGYIRQNERIYHFVSADGEQWAPAGSHYDSVMELSGWHNFFVRPASVVPLGIGYLFVYEGSNTGWFDPVYNLATGLGYTFDLNHVQELMEDAPLLLSTTPSGHFHTWRYSSWLLLDHEWRVYAEVAKPNQAHEIRLFRIKF